MKQTENPKYDKHKSKHISMHDKLSGLNVLVKRQRLDCQR